MWALYALAGTYGFDEVAGVKFHLKSLSPEEVARYAIDKMLHKKLLIMPGATIKITKFLVRLVPTNCFYTSRIICKAVK
jgi:short-subunit dehydrogenase